MSNRAAAVRVMLVERRDTVAPRDPRAPKIRRFRLARIALEGRTAPRAGAAQMRTT